MSDGDRSKRSAAGLVGIVLVTLFVGAALGGGLVYSLGQQVTYDQEAEYRITDYARNSRDNIQSACGAVPSVDQTDCVKQASERAQFQQREYERSELDLVAQKRMALWTAVMGIAALIGMAVSALGVWLVWTTFRETRRQAEIANDNLDALYETERAIVHAVGGKVGTSNMQDGDFVAIEFKNKGRSPGRIVEVGGNSPTGSNESTNQAPRWAVVPVGESVNVPAFPVPSKDALLKVDCWVKYRSVGPKVYTSYFTVHVRWFDGGNSRIVALAPRWVVDTTNSNGHPSDT